MESPLFPPKFERSLIEHMHGGMRIRMHFCLCVDGPGSLYLHTIALIGEAGRPWDYDHLVPQDFFNHYRAVPQAIRAALAAIHPDLARDEWDAVSRWRGSTGNYRAWPLGFNRKDGDMAAYDKLIQEGTLDRHVVLSGWWNKQQDGNAPAGFHPLAKASAVDLDAQKWAATPREKKEWTKDELIDFMQAVRQREQALYGALLDFIWRGVHFYRWDPRLLALPVAPDAQRRFRMDSSGFGLALCLDEILGYDREQFIHLENRFRVIFPQIKTIRLMQEPAYRGLVDHRLQELSILEEADGKGMYFEFVNGQQIPASQTSDGVLLVLAYLTMLYLPPPYRPRVVLVEEPENGIHPKLLQDVLGILRDLVKEQTTSQVILTTHFPYVLDLFEPKEVSLCRMTADGSVSVHRLSESQTVQEQLDIFTLGEIWTAEGDAALIPQGKPSETIS